MNQSKIIGILGGTGKAGRFVTGELIRQGFKMKLPAWVLIPLMITNCVFEFENGGF
jgi:hypothetical protein